MDPVLRNTLDLLWILGAVITLPLIALGLVNAINVPIILWRVRHSPQTDDSGDLLAALIWTLGLIASVAFWWLSSASGFSAHH